jgi:hypothetical protein
MGNAELDKHSGPQLQNTDLCPSAVGLSRLPSADPMAHGHHAVELPVPGRAERTGNPVSWRVSCGKREVLLGTRKYFLSQFKKWRCNPKDQANIPKFTRSHEAKQPKSVYARMGMPNQLDISPDGRCNLFAIFRPLLLTRLS